VLVGKLNEPKLKNIPVMDLYVVVGCPETSLIDSKEFMITVVTPHELLMALRPDLFPWQSKVITDFNELLPTLATAEPMQAEEDVLEESMALIKSEHRELVAVYSAQVINKYEQMQFKGLDLATQISLQGDGSGESGSVLKKVVKGKTGIASRYD